MKTKHLLLLGLIFILGSCSSAYRTGQTPDDVYYSPAPPQNGYVKTENQDEKDSYAYNNSTYNSEDMEIRRGIKDSRYRNNVSLNLGYGYDPYRYDSYGYNPYGYNSYGYGNHYGFNDPYGYNNAYANSYYSPYSSNYFPSVYSSYYYYPQVYIYPNSGGINRTITPRRYNLGAYSNNANTSILNHGNRPVNRTPGSSPIRNITIAPSSNRTVTPAATRAPGNGVGNFVRRVFTPDNNSRPSRSESNNSSNTYNNSSSSPVRTQSSSSSGSSSSSSSSSSAPVRTFRK